MSADRVSNIHCTSLYFEGTEGTVVVLLQALPLRRGSSCLRVLHMHGIIMRRGAGGLFRGWGARGGGRGRMEEHVVARLIGRIRRPEGLLVCARVDTGNGQGFQSRHSCELVFASCRPTDLWTKRCVCLSAAVAAETTSKLGLVCRIRREKTGILRRGRFAQCTLINWCGWRARASNDRLVARRQLEWL